MSDSTKDNPDSSKPEAQKPRPTLSIGGDVHGPVLVGDNNQLSIGGTPEAPADGPAAQSNGRLNLLDQMDETFSQQDLAELCFGLNVDIDNLGAEGKRHKMRELILLMRRTGREPDLLAACRAKRPHLRW